MTPMGYAFLEPGFRILETMAVGLSNSLRTRL
jgi:hypothetical protein